MQEFNYTKNAKKLLDVASDVARRMRHGYIGTEHLLYAYLEMDAGAATLILDKYGVKKVALSALIESTITPAQDIFNIDVMDVSPRFYEVIEKSRQVASSTADELIGTEHIFMAMIEAEDNTAIRLLTAMGIDLLKIYVEMLKAMGADLDMAKNFRKKGADGKESKDKFSLNQFCKDLTLLAKEGKLDKVVGRNDEIERLIQILSRRTKNNPCLIGEPGVGKTAIVEALASRMMSGFVPDTILGKRLMSLDLASVVAGTKYRGEFEDRIKRIVKEVTTRGDIILFIDEIHTMIGAGAAESGLDAANILKPSLARGEIQVIGATTIDEFRKHFEKDAALERRFQPITVEEPTVEETVKILSGVRAAYEKHHGVAITDDAVEAAASLSSRYINDRFLPDKAIDLMDEAASRVKLDSYKMPERVLELNELINSAEEKKREALKNKDFMEIRNIITETELYKSELAAVEKKYNKSKRAAKAKVTSADVADVVSKWTKIPVKTLKESEAKKLQKLESVLHKRVIGQDEAVTAVAKAVRRNRVGLKDPKKPIGSFLFLGPTGVGKTELSKALAEALFTSENAMIRVDMSEYMEKYSVSKLIGSAPGYVGYDEGGQLSERVRRNPYSIILFDEIEKAHPDVFNILLQVLDDGHITDSHGRKVDFKNTIIIMTSNAGANKIIDPKNLGFVTEKDEKADYQKMKEGVMGELKFLFRPEFLNRIDDIIVFEALTEKDMKKIVTLITDEIGVRTKNQLDITLTVTSQAKEHLVKQGFDKKYGARSLKRKVQELIEDALAEKIIAGDIKRGETVSVSLKKNELAFTSF